MTIPISQDAATLFQQYLNVMGIFTYDGKREEYK